MVSERGEMTAAGRGNLVRWVVVLGAALAVAVALAALVLRQPGGAGGLTSSLPSGLAGAGTARQAYPAAAELAQSWQPDARPAVISGHWRPRQGRWPTKVAWSFQFFSPETQRLAVVVVEDGRARLLRETLCPYVLPTFDEADWRVDSPAALQAWSDVGGANFLALNSEAELTAQLRVEQGGEGRLVWSVAGVAGDQVRIVVLDGRTGEQVPD